MPTTSSFIAKVPPKHGERESLAAAIKGLGVDEHLRQKQESSTRDPVDDFAAWHERFRHELATEFGEVPDDDDLPSIKKYIKTIKQQIS